MGQGFTLLALSRVRQDEIWDPNSRWWLPQRGNRACSRSASQCALFEVEAERQQKSLDARFEALPASNGFLIGSSRSGSLVFSWLELGDSSVFGLFGHIRESSVQLNMQPVQATILGRAGKGNLFTDL